MNSLDKHIKETITLTNSLSIKITDLAIGVNKGLFLKHKITPDIDKRKWKYYLNISGAPHETNLEIKPNGSKQPIAELTLIETGKRYPITKNLLLNNPYSRNELKKGESYYKELILRYPTEEAYIKGCLYPCDIEKAINAEDGTILAYNDKLVESGEVNLIKELEKFIKSFLKRWHVKEYTLTDELYLTSMLSVLYSTLPNKIINIRLDKINTNEVHSFHLENYFNSNLKLWDHMTIFNKETIYWLYKNLPYLIKNIGKNDTLNKIVNKVFDKNMIGVGEYVLYRNNPEVSKTPNNMLIPSYVNKDPVLDIVKLNSSYERDTDKLITIERLVEDELYSIFHFDSETYHYPYVIKNVKKELQKIHKHQMSKQHTKILDLKINKFFKNYGVNLFDMILDHWAFLLHKNSIKSSLIFKDPNDSANKRTSTDKKIEPLMEFVDPTTSNVYKITPTQGFLMVIKLLVNITENQNDRLRSYRYKFVLNPDKTVLYQIYNKMYKDGYLDLLLPELVNNYPKVDGWIFNQESFNDYLNSILNYYSYVWTIDSNSESISTSAGIKFMFNKALLQDEWYFVPGDKRVSGMLIDDILATHGISYTLTSTHDLMSSLDALVHTFTGIHVDDMYTKEEMLAHSKAFINKLTSYTTQVLTTSDEIGSIYLYYNNTGIFKTKRPIIGEFNASFHALEHEFSEIKIIGLNVIDDPIVLVENMDGKESNFLRIPPTNGIGVLDNDDKKFSMEDSPNTLIQLRDEYVYPAVSVITDENEIDIDPPEYI